MGVTMKPTWMKAARILVIALWALPALIAVFAPDSIIWGGEKRPKP